MRFAVYYAPEPGSLLHRLGSQWLGRDAFLHEPLPQPRVDGLAGITAEARRYGFHATLKPPFALASDGNEDNLVDAVRLLSAQLQPVEIGIAIRAIDGFLALAPAHPSPALDVLAAQCVRGLDHFRKSADDAELKRRRAAALSPRQVEYLVRWGYPYVFEEFRFHMTLTRRLTEAEFEAIRPRAAEHFAEALAAPLIVDSLSIFTEPEAGADFIAHRQFPLRGTFARVAS